jgi:hypothetical protein
MLLVRIPTLLGTINTFEKMIYSPAGDRIGSRRAKNSELEWANDILSVRIPRFPLRLYYIPKNAYISEKKA